MKTEMDLPSQGFIWYIITHHDIVYFDTAGAPVTLFFGHGPLSEAISGIDRKTYMWPR